MRGFAKGAAPISAVVLSAALLSAGCAMTAKERAERSNNGKRAVAARPGPAPGFLKRYAETDGFSLGRPRSITPTPDGEQVLFLRSGPRSFVQNLYAFDAKTGEERAVLSAEDLLGGAEEQLSEEEKARRERMRQAARGIASYRLSKDGERILVPLSGRLFVVERDSGEVTELRSEAGFPIDPQLSPDGSKVGVVRDGDLYVIDIESGEERRLTHSGEETITNGVSEFVAQEEMDRFHGYWWSPDGETIAYQRTDLSPVETLYIMDPAEPAKEPQAWRYPRAGTDNAKVRLGLIPAEGGETTWVEWDREKYPYLATVKWPENGPLTILVQNRRQTEQVLLKVDEASGYTTPLLVEKDPAWLNLDQAMPRWLPDGSGFFWTTERNGAWQLEVRDADGSLRRTLTSTDFGYRGFVTYLEEKNAAVVRAARETTETHVWLVPLDPTQGGPRRMTHAFGAHRMIYGEKGPLRVHVYETRDGRRGWAVKGAGGEELGELRSVAEKPSFDVNLQVTRVEGERSYDAAIIRPRGFKDGRKYPVIVRVYGGPHGKMVTAAPGGYALDQWLADHGFIVVRFDGRGAPRRGRAWERAVKGNLIDIPLHDQVDALLAAGERFDELDLDRIGIFGWSFGGYFSAHAAMRRPDVYHAAVAGAPVARWRDYDTHYTERYMGLPQENQEGYEASSALTYTDELERPLMIIHGTADDNVYFMHGLKLADALFEAGKTFRFVPLANKTHMVTEPAAVKRLYSNISRFFVERLKPGERGRRAQRRGLSPASAGSR